MLSALEADRARVVEIAARLLDLDSERSIADLCAEQATTQQRLDSYKYPVLTLPHEIVSEIFIRFLPTFPVLHPTIGKDSPTLLTEICHKWREVALATPELWRVIALCDSHIPKGITRCVPPISELLRRSGSFPLCILVNDESTALQVSRETISTLAEHCDRWEHAKLRIGYNLRVLDRPMPLLQHLDLRLDFPVPMEWRDLPQLRSVVLDNFAAKMTLPWAQLTSLTLVDGVELPLCVAILHQAKQLVRCTLNLSPYHEIMDPDISVALPRLRSLVLTTKKARYVPPLTDFFAALSVPALIELHVQERILGWEYSDPIISLASFISKSGCKLQELRITARRRPNNLPQIHRRYREAAFSNFIPSVFIESPND
ncbi:hypothetical protein C8R45DRAFT_905325 [Mycena sanguinolenta]|nr:hypothetical protein C8R45DRAFT_905325 [Mycena sanguinolenta]